MADSKPALPYDPVASLFLFRAPDPPFRLDPSATDYRIVQPYPFGSSDFLERLRAELAKVGEPNIKGICDAATTFLASSEASDSLARLKMRARFIEQFLLSGKASILDVPAFVEDEVDPEEEDEYYETFVLPTRAIADAIVASTIVRTRIARPDDYILALRICNIVRWVKNGVRWPDDWTISDLMSRPVFVLPEFVSILAAASAVGKTPTTAKNDDLPNPDDKDGQADTGTPADENKQDGVDADAKCKCAPNLLDGDLACIDAALIHLSFLWESGQLQPNAKLDSEQKDLSCVFSALKLIGSETSIAFVEAIARLEGALRGSAQGTGQGQQPDLLVPVAGAVVSSESGALQKRSAVAKGPPDRWLTVGVSDLIRIEQALREYQLGEIASITTVMSGETLVQSVRRLSAREEVVVVQEENESVTENERQSTTRDELAIETQSVVHEERALEAGVQARAYGPGYDATGSAKTSFKTSVDSAQKATVSKAKEVTERAAQRVRKRVYREERRRLVQELEEKTEHSYKNRPGAVPVNGVYRWLNKVYDAQARNYGKRMMFGFVVPEPGIFLLWNAANNSPASGGVVNPRYPSVIRNGKKRVRLKPSDLNAANYLDFVGLYSAAGVTSPPTWVAFASESFSGKDGEPFPADQYVAQLPAGYRPATGYVVVDIVENGGQHDNASIMLMIGTAKSHIATKDSTREDTVEIRNPTSEKVAITGIPYQLASYSGTVEVCGILQLSEYRKWQQDTFQRIEQGYKKQRDEYVEYMRLLQYQADTKRGGNPLDNRRIESDELKKWLIMLLENDQAIGRNAFEVNDDDGRPILHPAAAALNARRIAFFESVFEWENMVYGCYPYWWGDESHWTQALTIADADPDFATFLRSGAAKVILPVRRGYERAVAYFCQSQGQIWDGNDPPLVSDSVYAPAVVEMQEHQDDEETELSLPNGQKTWKVTVPTSLIIVQSREEAGALIAEWPSVVKSQTKK